MKTESIDLVQTSFAKVVPIADVASGLFYNRLFEIAPAVRAMFPDDITEQRKKLMMTLAVAVNGLRDFDAIAPTVGMLAVRHNAYGVLPEHYPIVGAALLWTLEQGLGSDFTPEVRDAWVEIYTALSGFMIQAAAAETA